MRVRSQRLPDRAADRRPPFGEGRILNVAGAYQSDTHWHRDRPAILEAAA
jgi:hypothetical protein